MNLANIDKEGKINETLRSSVFIPLKIKMKELKQKYSFYLETPLYNVAKMWIAGF